MHCMCHVCVMSLPLPLQGALRTAQLGEMDRGPEEPPGPIAPMVLEEVKKKVGYFFLL